MPSLALYVAPLLWRGLVQLVVSVQLCGQVGDEFGGRQSAQPRLKHGRLNARIQRVAHERVVQHASRHGDGSHSGEDEEGPSGWSGCRSYTAFKHQLTMPPPPVSSTADSSRWKCKARRPAATVETMARHSVRPPTEGLSTTRESEASDNGLIKQAITVCPGRQHSSSFEKAVDFAVLHCFIQLLSR